MVPAYYGCRDVGHAKVGLGPCGSLARGQRSKVPKSSGLSSSGFPDKPCAGDGGGVCKGQPSLVQEGNVKPSSEFAPLELIGLLPEFNHIVAMQFAHTNHIPEMVQAAFYATVINDAARLRLIRREIGESLMSDLRKLRWDVIKAWLLFIEDKLKEARR
ncbi:hypothetical protein Cgig2_012682 [Carnegiea gigantea]|uniref:Uncharacterized protein n=1 Tax=Carnegiea gigantea TaxID=171969 RepID=A0A9Q1JZX9_9CARY|nr:hypothetical protein Cgig2_012682 [Carnegiea gigantea]